MFEKIKKNIVNVMKGHLKKYIKKYMSFIQNLEQKKLLTILC